MMAKTPTGLSQDRLDELNRTIDRFVDDGTRTNQAWSDYYRDGMDFIWNNQLAGERRRDGWPRVQLNQIFPGVMQELSLLAQRKPAIRCVGWEASDRDAAKLWGGILQWQFEKALNVPMHLVSQVLVQKSHGHCVGRLWWDSRAKWDHAARRWDGQVKLAQVRPEAFGLDSEAASVDEAAYAFVLVRRSLLGLIAKFPQWRAQILEAARGEREGERMREMGISAGGNTPRPWASAAVTLDGDPVPGERDGGLDCSNEARLVELITGTDPETTGQLDVEIDGETYPAMVSVLDLLFRDEEQMNVNERVQVPIEQLVQMGMVYKSEDERGIEIWRMSETGEPLTPDTWPGLDRSWREPRYPSGRHVVRIGGRLVLVDEPWPYERWPYVVGVNVPIPFTRHHGLNSVEAPMPHQRLINRLGAQIANNVACFGDPNWLVEEGALANDPENRKVASRLKAAAGKIIKLMKGGLNRIRREPGLPLGPAQVDAFKLLVSELQNQTGVHEIALGRQVGGTATEAIRLETNTRMRTALQSLMLDEYTTTLMELVVMLCRAHLTPEQMVRVAGQGEADLVAQVSQTDLDARFDLRLQVGTAMPFDRERRKADAATLYGIIGLPYLPRLLEAYDEEDAEELLAQMAEYQQFMQFQQAMQAQSGAVGTGGGGLPVGGGRMPMADLSGQPTQAGQGNKPTTTAKPDLPTATPASSQSPLPEPGPVVQ